jgi:uncharacterized protein (DUF2249 family)
MHTPEPFTLDVRDELRRGGEPLPRILAAVNALQPGQALRLFSTFEPLPLYAVLGRKGYGHSSRHIGVGNWEVLFTPGSAPAMPAGARSGDAERAPAADTGGWPTARVQLDNRGLEPPEPLVRILEALEHLAPGEVLEAINERDPVFLYPELEARGAAIRTEKRAEGGLRLLIRRGA